MWLIWIRIRLSYYCRRNIEKYPLFIIFQPEIGTNGNAFSFGRNTDNRGICETALLEETSQRVIGRSRIVSIVVIIRTTDVIPASCVSMVCIPTMGARESTSESARPMAGAIGSSGPAYLT